MTAPKIESVLTIPTSEFIKNGVFQGFAQVGNGHDLGKYLTANPKEPRIAGFVERSKAETDLSLKQLIPYCIIMVGESVLTYVRGKSGGENRLHDKLSIGIGGHIDLEDDEDGDSFFAYMNGTLRELREEIGLELDRTSLMKTVIGFVNNEENDVGKVHLGIVHVINVTEQQAAKILENCEHTMTDPSFVPIKEFGNKALHGRLETWSADIVTHLLGENELEGKWSDKAFIERIQLFAITASNVASAAGGFAMQDNPRGHILSREGLEKAIGEFACMMTGVIQNGDVAEENVQQACDQFHQQLPNILNHQVFNTKASE